MGYIYHLTRDELELLLFGLLYIIVFIFLLFPKLKLTKEYKCKARTFHLHTVNSTSGYTVWTLYHSYFRR
jgi:hypothetical protein